MDIFLGGFVVAETDVGTFASVVELLEHRKCYFLPLHVVIFNLVECFVVV